MCFLGKGRVILTTSIKTLCPRLLSYHVRSIPLHVAYFKHDNVDFNVMKLSTRTNEENLKLQNPKYFMKLSDCQCHLLEMTLSYSSWVTSLFFTKLGSSTNS